MPVPDLKEQIASVTGVLSERQRLICQGKVLKDDQLLSAYRILYLSSLCSRTLGRKPMWRFLGNSLTKMPGFPLNSYEEKIWILEWYHCIIQSEKKKIVHVLFLFLNFCSHLFFHFDKKFSYVYLK